MRCLAPAVSVFRSSTAKVLIASATGRVSLRKLSRKDRDTGRLWNTLLDITEEDLSLTRKVLASDSACWLVRGGVKLSKVQLHALVSAPSASVM